MSASFVVTYPCLRFRHEPCSASAWRKAAVPRSIGASFGASQSTSGTVFWTTYESCSVRRRRFWRCRKDFKTFSLTFIAGVLNVLSSNALGCRDAPAGRTHCNAVPGRRSRKSAGRALAYFTNTVLVLFRTLRTLCEALLMRLGDCSDRWPCAGLSRCRFRYANRSDCDTPTPVTSLAAASDVISARLLNEEKASIWDGLSIKLVHSRLEYAHVPVEGAAHSICLKTF